MNIPWWRLCEWWEYSTGIDCDERCDADGNRQCRLQSDKDSFESWLAERQSWLATGSCMFSDPSECIRIELRWSFDSWKHSADEQCLDAWAPSVAIFHWNCQQLRLAKHSTKVSTMHDSKYSLLITKFSWKYQWLTVWLKLEFLHSKHFDWFASKSRIDWLVGVVLCKSHYPKFYGFSSRL